MRSRDADPDAVRPRRLQSGHEDLLEVIIAVSLQWPWRDLVRSTARLDASLGPAAVRVERVPVDDVDDVGGWSAWVGRRPPRHAHDTRWVCGRTHVQRRRRSCQHTISVTSRHRDLITISTSIIIFTSLLTTCPGYVCVSWQWPTI